MMPIPILFTIPNFKTAGSGQEMVHILHRLDKRRFEPWIGVNETGGDLYDQLEKEGYRLIHKPFSSPESDSMGKRIRSANTLGHFLKSQKVGIWQSFHWSSDFSEALAARMAGIPYVYTKKNMNWGRKAWLVKSWMASAIVARNRDMLERFFSGSLYQKKVYWIPGGVEEPKRGQRPRGYFRNLFPNPDRPLIVCLAQLVRSKDQQTLIKALSSMEEVNLILAGAHRDPEYLEQLNLQIRQEGMVDRVWNKGAIKELGDLLGDADLFVLPTGLYGGHEEGCPVALMEAMSVGLPSVGSDVAGIRDLIQVPETGWLFQPHNEEDLRLQIQDALSRKQEAEIRGEKAKERVRLHHGLDREAQSFQEVYEALLSTKS